ncbi:MAG: winged helix-turn-helix domain-containing protein [Burkholderiaceae bacterium]
MHITQRQDSDAITLRARARREKNAEQRDRYRVALLAIDGRETGDIQERLHRSRGFVQRWAYAYRDGGIEALKDKPRGGSRPKLPRELEAAFKARIDAGPRPEDGVCTLRGKDAQRILNVEFGVAMNLGNAYRMLHRLGYSCLKPRPRHEKQNPQAQQAFRERAPFLSAR